MTRTILDNCPYNCNRGKIYVPATGSYQDCPHCAEYYRGIASGKEVDKEGKDIYEILAIPEIYRNKYIEIEDIFTDAVIKTTSQESREKCKSLLQEIYNCILTATPLTTDYLFFLGVEVDLLPIVYKLQREAYANGMTVTPYVNTLELIALYKDIETLAEGGYKEGKQLSEYYNKSFFDFCKDDFVIVELPSILSQESVGLVLTLINERHKRGLYTVIFSNTLGKSRELGYVINNQDVRIGAIEKTTVFDSEPSGQYTFTKPSQQAKEKTPEAEIKDFNFSSARQNYGIVDK